MDQSLLRIRLDKVNILVCSSCALSFIISSLYYGNYADGYRLMILFPIVFFVVYILFLQSLRDSNFPFTAYGIIGIEWIRLVLMPPVCASAGVNAGFSYINPTTESLTLATLLIMYELIIVAVISNVWIKHVKTNRYFFRPNDRLMLKGNKFVYAIFILIALGIMVTLGREESLFSFFYIPIDEKGRLGDITDTYLILARQIITVAFFVAFLWTVQVCKLRYSKYHNAFYINLAIIMALLNVAIIIGERRIYQVYTAIVSGWILLRIFPMHRRRILLSIGTTAFLVVLLMSIYKFFEAFQFGSYSAALSNATADIPWFSRTLQSYFFGPENVAVTIDFARTHNSGLENLLFDFLRSTFGVSFLMKGQGVLTSELFNTYIYGKPTPTGHILSAVGYGYMYLGILLSPIIAALNIFISSTVEKIMYKSQSYEMTYVWGYILARFATNLFVNTAPLISYSTIMLGTAGLLFITATITRVKRNCGRPMELHYMFGNRNDRNTKLVR